MPSIPSVPSKICVRCKHTRPLTHFNRYTRSPDGHQAHCRDCSKAYYRDNRARHLRNVARTRHASSDGTIVE